MEDEAKELEVIDHGENLPMAEASAPANLIEIALTKGADIATIEKLVAMQNAFEEKEARRAFFAALSGFQAEIPTISKKGNVNFNQTNFDYAKIEDITSAIKPFLLKYGLSYRFEQDQGDMIEVSCIVTHAAGHSEATKMKALPDASGKKNPIQEIASSVTYLRRYTLTGALGITVGGEDNDGGAPVNEREDAKVSALDSIQAATTVAGLEGIWNGFTPRQKIDFKADVGVRRTEIERGPA